MKRLKTVCALLAASLFIFTGCDSSGGGGGGGGGGGDPEFSVNGSFTSGGDTSYYKANEAKGGRGVFSRAAGDDTFIPLEGTLDDGDITFKLKGSYDMVTESYTLSSASTYVRYTINSDQAGTTSASIATRSNKSEPFENPVIVAVNSDITDTAITTNMVNTKEASVEAGLTEKDWYGSWYQNEAGKDMRFLVDEWGLHLSVKDGNTWVEGETLSFAKITDNEDSTYDLVVDLPVVDWEETIEGFEVSFRDYPLYLESIGFLIFDPNEWPSFSKYGGNALVYKEPVYDDSENIMAGSKNYSPCISYTNKDSRTQSLDGAINVEGTIVRILHEPKVVSTDWNDDGTYVQNYDYSSPYIIKTCALSELEAAELYFDAEWAVHEDRYATIAEALAEAKGLFGGEDFDAEHYRQPNDAYTAALKEIAGKMEPGETASTAVIAAALKKYVPMYKGVTDKTLKVYNTSGSLDGASVWLDTVEGKAWGEKYNSFYETSIRYSEAEFAYMCLKASYDSDKSTLNLEVFTVHNDPAEFRVDSLKGATNLQDTGDLNPLYTLTR